MPRLPRIESKTGFYHVMLRGNARQILFESDADRLAFLHYLDRAIDEPDYALIAWCLMDNHVHLLVYDPEGKTAVVVKRFATSYAMRFNRRADRVGHVFQGRYRCQPIDSERQLLEVVRYIHNNPVEAGVCAARDYPWSSYSEYVGDSVRCETEPVLEMLGGPTAFESFCAEKTTCAYEPVFGKRPTEEQLIEVARSLLDVDDPSMVKTLPIGERNLLLLRLRDGGFSIRQTERVTGVGRGAVERVFSSDRHLIAT